MVPLKLRQVKKPSSLNGNVVVCSVITQSGAEAYLHWAGENLLILSLENLAVEFIRRNLATV